VTNLVGLAQFSAMAALGLPRHLQWRRGHAGTRLRWLPTLRHTVPLRQWLGVVALFFATSLMTNVAFRFHVSMPVQIIVRSGSLCVSMLYGVLYFKRRYVGIGEHVYAGT
jgi:solute carrier family 35 (UDP-xylose/UDP-N-acetylglucosamine transporter), member B4